MSRKSLNTSTDGTKVGNTIAKCSVCGNEIKAADGAKWVQAVSGATSYVYDCKGCHEPYTITFTVP